MGQWLDVPVGEHRMRCFLVTPANPDAPGILVAMHGPGIDDFIENVCERLAAAGFAVIAPDLYHRQRPPLVEPWTRIQDSEALADMAAARTAVLSRPGVDAQRHGAIGFCMGGRLAFLYAAHTPALRAAVVFHGGNIMVASDLASPFAQAEQITAPMLGLFGAEDTNPTAHDVQTIDGELTRLGKLHEFHVYPGAGHAFLNFTRPEVFRPGQAEDAWARCLTWLEEKV